PFEQSGGQTTIQQSPSPALVYVTQPATFDGRELVSPGWCVPWSRLASHPTGPAGLLGCEATAGTTTAASSASAATSNGLRALITVRRAMRPPSRASTRAAGR